jgi:hypothetical protein
MQSLISLNEIRLDGGTQMRDEINYHTVDDYSHAYASGVDMPEPTVFCDGSNNWLGDGFHRWHGAKKAGKKSLLCNVRQGSQRDAILFAIGANDKHGLRRTPADKRKAVRALLLDEEWRAYSDREIAKIAKVSHTFVAEQRKQLPKVPTGNVASCEDGQAERRKGKDGKKRRVKRKSRRARAEALRVPPIDEEVEDNRPLNGAAVDAAASRMKAGDFTAPVRSFDDERNLVRALADLVQIVKKTQYKASIDKGRLMHELNEWSNDIAEAIEEAEAK